MQTYIVNWQFPDQESHMQGAEAFAGLSKEDAKVMNLMGLKFLIE